MPLPESLGLTLPRSLRLKALREVLDGTLSQSAEPALESLDAAARAFAFRHLEESRTQATSLLRSIDVQGFDLEAAYVRATQLDENAREVIALAAKGHNARLRDRLIDHLDGLEREALASGMRPKLFKDQAVAALQKFDAIPPGHPFPSTVLATMSRPVELIVHAGKRAAASLAHQPPMAADTKLAATPVATPIDKLALRMQPSAAKVLQINDGPMGDAHPQFHGSAWPVVRIVQQRHECAFVPTKAVESGAHTCEIIPIGEFEVGTIYEVEGTTVSVNAEGRSVTYRNVEAATPDWVGLKMKRGVTPSTYKRIQVCELEHLIDFSYAFQISAGRVAGEVNALAGSKFTSREAAMEKLLVALADADALIPPDPHQPDQWPAHLEKVAIALAGMSDQRDKRGTHSPKGNRGRRVGAEVIVEPLMGTESLTSESIVLLDRIDVVFASSARRRQALDKNAMGSTRVVARNLNVDFLRNRQDRSGVLYDKLPKGTEVKLEQDAPAAGPVLVSFALKLAPELLASYKFLDECAGMTPDSTIFAKVDVAALT